MSYRPVVAEHHQVGARGQGDQPLRQLDHARPRQGQAIAARKLIGHRLLDIRVPVPENHRPIGAHPVDVLIAVDVPHVRALAPHEEARVKFAVGGAVLMAVHAARHDAPGALPQRMTRSQPARRRLHGPGIIASEPRARRPEPYSRSAPARRPRIR
jgi:hypothetical protein